MRHSGTDRSLESRVLKRLARDRRLDAARVDVAAEDGVVRLLGTVPDELARSLALFDALDVHGVARAVNELQVDEHEP